MIGTKTSDYTGEAAQRFKHYKLVRSEDGKPDFWAVDHKLFVLREGDIIVVWKPDRLARSTRDLLETMATIREAEGRFQSISGNPATGCTQ
jgi:Resolvase, N terminal domain